MDNELKKKKQRFSDSFYNNITYIGVGLSLFVLLCELFLFAIDFASPKSSIYLGLLTYVFLPPFLIVGLILIPIGASLKRGRLLRGSKEGKPKPIVIDLSLATHQNAVVIFMIGTVTLLVMTAIGSYRAFNYTESTQFCGLTCHQIMKPEYDTHNHSPHERVRCVECHVGSGANWYLRYKVAGTKMLVKTFDGRYQRPTPAPLNTLRPAKEICEQCHWPGKPFSAILLNKVYYADDPSQTPPWRINLLMRVGNGKNGEAGIHAHMYFNNEIFYVADDAKRQHISWVKTVDKSGKATIYTSKNSPYKKVNPPQDKIRRMDCIDCHNRAAHRFEAPDVLMNRALAQGKISPSIPMIKSEGVEVLGDKYNSTSQAEKQIRSKLTDYYKQKYFAYYTKNRPAVEQAAEEITLLYGQNFFPEMKSRWDDYPDNIGHMISRGCFRCHDNEHKSADGKVIERKCTLCHIIVEQGSGTAVQKSINGLDFQHPFYDDDSWKTTNCSDCHTGG
ncbi:MAG: NapC/NirT family cytochrome c [Candidatus Omnitrophica bacterium]|nr:NapC/NirT family cytochrome c [Candidatus Omnitrophota bacterium]